MTWYFKLAWLTGPGTYTGTYTGTCTDCYVYSNYTWNTHTAQQLPKNSTNCVLTPVITSVLMPGTFLDTEPFNASAEPCLKKLKESEWKLLNKRSQNFLKFPGICWVIRKKDKLEYFSTKNNKQIDISDQPVKNTDYITYKSNGIKCWQRNK